MARADAAFGACIVCVIDSEQFAHPVDSFEKDRRAGSVRQNLGCHTCEHAGA